MVDITDTNIDYYASLARTKSIEDFGKNILKRINNLGFSDFSFVRLESVNDQAPLITITKDLINDYYKDAFYEHNIMLPYAKQNKKPIFHSDLYAQHSRTPLETESSLRLRELQILNAFHGYSDYFSIPLEALNQYGHIIFSVTIKNKPSTEIQSVVIRNMSDLLLLAKSIDYIGSKLYADQLFGDGESRKIKFTNKAIEVIDALANYDLSQNDIAKKLNMAPSTLKGYISKAKMDLNVKHTNALIKEAIQLKLISYRDIK